MVTRYTLLRKKPVDESNNSAFKDSRWESEGSDYRGALEQDIKPSKLLWERDRVAADPSVFLCVHIQTTMRVKECTELNFLCWINKARLHTEWPTRVPHNYNNETRTNIQNANTHHIRKTVKMSPDSLFNKGPAKNQSSSCCSLHHIRLLTQFVNDLSANRRSGRTQPHFVGVWVRGLNIFLLQKT